MKAVGTPLHLKRKLLLQMAFGYAMPLLPPTWFVTEVVVMVLFTFPATSLLCTTAPVATTIGATCLSAVALQNPGLCGRNMRALGFDGNRDFDWLLHPLIYVGRVAFGILLEKSFKANPTDTQALLASAVYLLGCRSTINTMRGAFAMRWQPHFRDALAATLDLPLATVALWIAAKLASCTTPAMSNTVALGSAESSFDSSSFAVSSFAIEWVAALGKRSWTVYLGHITVLQFVFLRMGIFASWTPNALQKTAIFLAAGLAFDGTYSAFRTGCFSVIRSHSDHVTEWRGGKVTDNPGDADGDRSPEAPLEVLNKKAAAPGLFYINPSD
jgi:hypothetical protein